MLWKHEHPPLQNKRGLCVLCAGLLQNRLHIFFLHCSKADFSCTALFGIFGDCWGCPRALDQFLLTRFVGFGRKKEAKSLW